MFYLVSGAAVVLLVLFTDPTTETASTDTADSTPAAPIDVPVAAEAVPAPETNTDINPDLERIEDTDDEKPRHTTAGM